MPTDKERLDWLTKQEQHMELSADLCEAFPRGIGWGLTHQEEFYRTPRAAIDAAIRASKLKKGAK